MKQCIVFFLCMCMYCANAQIDSLPDQSFDASVKLFYEFIYKDASKALVYANQAKNFAEIHDDKEQLSKAFYYMARSYNASGENTAALKNVELALSTTVSEKDVKFTYLCFSLKGDILSELGENTKALKAYLEAKELAVTIGNTLYESAVMLNIAYIKKLHKDFPAAIGMYKKVFKQLNTTLKNNPDATIYRLGALINIADSYLWLKVPDKAEIYTNAGLSECADATCPQYYTLLMNKAIIQYQRAQYEECILLSNKIKDSVLARAKQGLYITSLFYLGKSSFQLDETQDAIDYLEEALSYINKSENVDSNEKELHEFLALLYNQLGNSEKGLFHFNHYRTLEKKQSADDLKIKDEMHQLIDIASLDAEIIEIKEVLAKQTKNKKILLVAASILFVLLVSSIVYYRKREKNIHRKFDDLLQKVAELEAHEEKEILPKKEKVSDEKAKVILDKIADFERKEYYLLVACSLGFMANKLGTNTAYLSKVINKYKKKSFTAYITELRINTALVRLKNDTTLQSYTIKAIAEEFGFKRQETFAKAFKAHTGIYPSQYLKNLKKNA